VVSAHTNELLVQINTAKRGTEDVA